MFAFSRPLGDAVKKARMEKGLTQGQLATLVDADERTIINIETYKANTTMQVLFPLVKVLGLDPRVIFWQQDGANNPAKDELLALIAGCSEDELEILEMVCKSVLAALRAKNGIPIAEKKSLPPLK